MMKNSRLLAALALGFLLAPLPVSAQLISTGPSSGLTLYYSGPNSWSFDPGQGYLSIKVAGVLVSTIDASGNMWVKNSIATLAPTASNQVATKGYVDAA